MSNLPLLGEAVQHHEEARGLLEHGWHVVSHQVHVWPEVLGGFMAYLMHTLHHRIFHITARLLPRALRGGH